MHTSLSLSVSLRSLYSERDARLGFYTRFEISNFFPFWLKYSFLLFVGIERVMQTRKLLPFVHVSTMEH